MAAAATNHQRCSMTQVSSCLLFVGLLLSLAHASTHGIRRGIVPQQLQPVREQHGRKEHGDWTWDGPRLKMSPTHSGYVAVNASAGSDMLFTYFEAQQVTAEELNTTPIVLWLQGGPGCSSLFGMLYINGPYFVNGNDLTLRANPGSWNRLYGMLFVEQPIAVGFSHAGTQSIPSSELGVARDLYLALNNWYAAHPEYAHRPLIITGESYAGKYVPSIAHYVLQATARVEGWEDRLAHARLLPPDTPAPGFKLGGLAIGNGWTDADVQQGVQGDVAWAMGLIDLTQKAQIDRVNAAVLEQLRSKNFRKARALSDTVNEMISNWSATYTLEDVRRNLGYDGYELVDAYLNQGHVKKALGADESLYWVSCSPEVDHVMGHDVMKSVKGLVVDLLGHRPVLLYHGQFDAECGVASNDAWISTMKWPEHSAFVHSPRKTWVVNGRVLGFWRQHAHLTTLVVRNTGHMVPHDNPYYGQLLIERWIEEAVRGRQYNRQYSESDEKEYLRVRGPDEGPTAGPPKQSRKGAQAGARSQLHQNRLPTGGAQ